MQFTSLCSRRWSLVWAGAVPHDGASFWVVQSCVFSLQQCAPVKNLASPETFGKPEGSKCTRYCGSGCFLSPLCPAYPDPLGTSLGSPSTAQHQFLPKGHKLVSLAQPCEGDCSWLSWLTIWNYSSYEHLGARTGRVFYYFHFAPNGEGRLWVSGYQNKNRPWSWPGCEWDKAGAWVGQASVEAFAAKGIWEICGQVLRSALNCDSDCSTITSYQTNQQERSLLWPRAS